MNGYSQQIFWIENNLINCFYVIKSIFGRAKYISIVVNSGSMWTNTEMRCSVLWCINNLGRLLPLRCRVCDEKKIIYTRVVDPNCIRGRRCGFSCRCDQQLTCLVSLLKICDIMGAAILFFVLKIEVVILLWLLLCSIWHLW